MSTLKKLDGAGLAFLLILSIMWGSSFTFIKIALESFGPLSIAAGRISLAALLLVVIVWLKREALPTTKSQWGFLIVLSALGNSLPFFLIGWGEIHVDGGMTAVLMSVIPLSVPLMAHFLTQDEKMTWQMGLGILIGFVGLIVLVGPGVLQGLGSDLIHQGAIITAALCYGAASLVARHLIGISPYVIAAVSLSMASLTMVPLALMLEAPLHGVFEWGDLGAIVYLGLFPTALANILLLKVIKRNGVSFLALNNYLVPVFGVAIATLALGETVPGEMITSLIIIMIGIFVSNLKRNQGEGPKAK